MLPTNDDTVTIDRSPTPEMQTKSPEYKGPMSPLSTSSSEPQTVRKPKRKRKKGNNWTRKKHALQSPALTSDISPTPSPEIAQEEYKDAESLVEKGPEDMSNDSVMDIRRAAVEQDFGLRPDLSIMDKPKVPIKSIEETEPVLSEKSSLPDSIETSRIAPRKESYSILPTPETTKHDHFPATSPTDHLEESISCPNSNATERRCSNTSHTSDESPIIPPHFPPNPVSRPDRTSDLFWLHACMQVRRPDGTVHAPEVIVWLMTRKGGKKSSWPRLEAGLAEIEMMRKDTIDLSEIWRRQEEGDAIARAKEERRMANKRRCRPRGQIDRERAERRAALAAQKAQESEIDGADDTPKGDRMDDIDKNPVTKAEMNTKIWSDFGETRSESMDRARLAGT
ncbi:unnamed protein product [Fusarium venenatum]|uniref:Uncharacterized protein n=1 Tax=Fusarium venenatum TaxID=56646 RepID=A0A2L2T2Q6_9HYPO|nr:uncharacterized protein FVRRES_00470 [Fusarium venenatum]CEI63958.1 unnamed protein product [Fusarium venenatum]